MNWLPISFVRMADTPIKGGNFVPLSERKYTTA